MQIIKNNKITKIAIVALLFFILIANSVFIVEEAERAIVMQFGEAKYEILKSGVSVKIPLLQSVKKYDARYRIVEISSKELTCADNKRIVTNAFATVYIHDLIKFYSSVNNYNISDIRVRNILESCMREVIGRAQLCDLLSEDRSKIMQNISSSLGEYIEKYGMKVIDFRISKADLPEQNGGAIRQRMKTAREQEAKKIRAEGNAEYMNIVAEADREKEMILSNAYRNSQGIKSEGELASGKIYNKCYSQDTDFFKFIKSLEAYKNIFKNGETNFILPSSSKFFEYLKLNK